MEMVVDGSESSMLSLFSLVLSITQWWEAVGVILFGVGKDLASAGGLALGGPPWRTIDIQWIGGARSDQGWGHRRKESIRSIRHARTAAGDKLAVVQELWDEWTARLPLLTDPAAR